MENVTQIVTLAGARVSAGFTQQEAADRVNVTKQTIIRWENGKTLPNTAKAQELADMYQMPLQYIIFGKKSTVV